VSVYELRASPDGRPLLDLVDLLLDGVVEAERVVAEQLRVAEQQVEDNVELAGGEHGQVRRDKVGQVLGVVLEDAVELACAIEVSIEDDPGRDSRREALA